jgi:putative ABC transport system permease protein
VVSGPPGGARLWLRWAWRDLRQRWPLVLAIAALLGLGTALYAGFESQISWRISSYDQSFALLNVHDLRVELPGGAYAEQGSLAAIAQDSGVPIARVEERLVEDVQLEVGDGPEAILTRGRVVGAGGPAGPSIDAVAAHESELPTESEVAAGAVILEANFARYYELPTEGPVTVGRVGAAEYSAQGLSPEYFIVTDGESSFSSEANLGVLFSSLARAQELTGRSGRVNDVVLELAEGADSDREAAALEEAFARAGRGATVTTTQDIPAYRLMYEDADNDQKLFTIFAVLVLTGAALAAFNLINRVVDSQRREMGIGMALGLTASQVALRPALLGLQIALTGVVLGVLAGELIARWLGSLLRSLLLVPVFDTPFDATAFVTAGLLGLAVIVLATALAVWRALRLEPIEAINVGPRSRQVRRVTPLARLAHLPGRSLQQMPVRNLLRTPQRTLASVAAIGAVITVVVALLGILDGFRTTVDLIEQETVGATPTRTQVELDGFYPPGSPQVAGIAAAESVAVAEPMLRLSGSARGTDEDAVNLIIETTSGDSPIWHPTVVSGDLTETTPGILLSRAAARDLGVETGDRVALTHPQVDARGRLSVATSDVVVTGTHPNPFRFLAYVNARQGQALLGAGPVVNAARVVPRDDSTPEDVARELFGAPGVASVQGVSRTTDELKEGLQQFISFLVVPIVIALALALLIAFNSTSISADERVREHATMFAFGVPVRSVVWINVIESAIVGAVATLIGFVAGWYITDWVMTNQLREVLPDLEAVADLSASSLLIAGAAGILAVAVAPLLTVRRLRRLDLPSSLRVVE